MALAGDEQDAVPDLLQALECTLETVDRLSAVIEEFIDAHHQQRFLPPGVVTEYEEQLERVRADRAALTAMLARLWQIEGTERSQ
jgi:hypothetical protein